MKIKAADIDTSGLRMTIWMESKIKELGYSGRHIYDDEELGVSYGSTNGYCHKEQCHPYHFVFNINFRKLDVEIIGGDTLKDDFLHATDVGELPIFAHRLLMKVMNKDIFDRILNKRYKSGFEDGQDNIRSRFKILMEV